MADDRWAVMIVGCEMKQEGFIPVDQNAFAKLVREDKLPNFPTPSARHVFGAMASFACGNTHCWPSKATLASVTGLSVRTVDSAIKALESAGFVRIVSRGGSSIGGRKANRYDLFLSNSNTSADPRNQQQDPRNHCGAPPQPATATPATIAGDPRNQRHLPPQPLRSNSEEKSEGNQNTNSNPRGEVDSFQLAFQAFMDAGGDEFGERMTFELFLRAVQAAGLGRVQSWRLREACEYGGNAVYLQEDEIRNPMKWLASVLRGWADKHPAEPAPDAMWVEWSDWFRRLREKGPGPDEDERVWSHDLRMRRLVQFRICEARRRGISVEQLVAEEVAENSEKKEGD